MKVEFLAQRMQLAALPAIHDRFADANCAAKTCDNSAHSGNFDLPRSVANQKHAARAHSPFDRRPAVIDRNFRALVSKRSESALLHKAFEAAASFLAIFANQTQDCAIIRFRNQPIKVGRIVWNEPDAHRML